MGLGERGKKERQIFGIRSNVITTAHTSPTPTSTEVGDRLSSTYLGSEDRGWGKVICVQQIPWQNKIPLFILLLIKHCQLLCTFQVISMAL